MSIEIRGATPADIPAIRAFNHRLDAGGGGFQFPETPQNLGVARDAGAPVWHDLFVASENTDVRAGYALKRELLQVDTEPQMSEIWNYQIPLSEGIVNKRYATLGIKLLQDALARQSRLYCLGMGSLTRPLPKLLQRFGWTVEEVPFRFRVMNAGGFLGNIEFLRTTQSRQILLNLLRWTGAGAIGVWTWRMWCKARTPSLPTGLSVAALPEFGVEADEIFYAFRTRYGGVVDRTAAALNVRFPPHDARLVRLLIKQDSRPVGWVVVSRSQCRNHKQFGNMKLGCIVDGFCDPAQASVLVHLATEHLSKLDVDLIVSNQSHQEWLAALQACGYLKGPSNYILGRSPDLAKLSPPLSKMHINRGDGDGPINL